MAQQTKNSTIKDVFASELVEGEQIQLSGWVRSKRSSKGGFSFIHLNDGSCVSTIQVIADESMDNYQQEIEKLSVGCSVSITGSLVASEGRGQDREIHATSISVIGWVDDPESYPIAKKKHSFEYLRTVAHLRVRTNTFGAITRLRNRLAQSVHRFFDESGFFWVNTPIITSSDCEGAGDMFRVSTLDQINRQETDFSEDFFGSETFLTVSGQLNLESYACALKKVYTFGPTFRAENSNTSRHLAEFWMIEPEIAFADLKANAKLAEALLKSVFQDTLSQNQEDLQFFDNQISPGVIDRLEKLVASDFNTMTYTDAVKVLKSSNKKFDFEVTWGADLQSEHERFLTEEVANGPLVVTDYPKDIKAFYMRLNDDEKTVAAMDILVPGVGEIVGGSQREERLAVLDQRMTDESLKNELWWYRDLRRYGTVPHAGFGLGFERLVQYVSGMDNIRDTIPFPRVPNNAAF
ncbi:asparagine--tRNA ligase [Gammaproteobacteria bacterium]|nr:asparagine--tRNA ligase [Gammaproteobacteria bacterium]